MSQADKSARPLAYMVKLLPPRASFLVDATPAERAIMREHADYWRAHLEDGLVVAFGPVNDPAGSFGIGLVRVSEAAELDDFLACDPAIQSGIGLQVQALPMPALISSCAP